jgi:uncharacterized protein with FMN-binding domain
MSTGLVALGSAAVFAVYSAGYLKTKAAADKLNEPRAPRRSTLPDSAQPAVVAAGGATAIQPTPGQPVVQTAAPAPTVTLELPTTPMARATAPDATPAIVDPQVSKTSAAAPVPTPATAVAPPVAAAETPVAGTAVAAATAATPPASASASAASSVPATAVPQAAKYKDGTYTGWGSCRHGDIQAQVVVAGGRITSAEISQCLTRYSCSWISPLPPQVLQRQSPEVDYVSGATQSAVAFYDALVDALSKAK